MAAGLVPAVMVVAYLAATRRVRRPWPAGRTAAFVAGAALLGLALALDGDGSFATHATQHLLLGMAGPALLALGAPVTLALQASPPARRGRLLRVLHGRPAAVACHPVAAWALFGGSMLALYLTPLYRLTLDHEALHVLVHAHFVAVGCLFFWPVLGADPLPRRLPHGARLLMVFLTIPFHAVLGMALLGAAPLAARYTVADHQAGTAVLWAAGDVLGLVAVLVVAAQWMAAEERQAAREDRLADLTG